MSLWKLLWIVVAAGGIGGIVNAYITDNGFVIPRIETGSNGAKIVRPGYLGNIFIGMISSAMSWGLYGPFANHFIVGTPEAMMQNPTAVYGLTLGAIIGAALVGIGGARWLTNEVDKTLLQAAASEAANRKSSPDVSKQIAVASPAQALFLAKNLLL